MNFSRISFLAALVAASLNNPAHAFDLNRFVREYITDASNARVDDLEARVNAMQSSQAMKNKSFSSQVYDLRRELERVDASNTAALTALQNRTSRLEAQQSEIIGAVVQLAVDNREQDRRLMNIEDSEFSPSVFVGGGPTVTGEGFGPAGAMSLSIGNQRGFVFGGSLALGTDLIFVGTVGKKWESVAVGAGLGYAGSKQLVGESVNPTSYLAGGAGSLTVTFGTDDRFAVGTNIVAGFGGNGAGKITGVAGDALFLVRLGK